MLPGENAMLSSHSVSSRVLQNRCLQYIQIRLRGLTFVLHVIPALASSYFLSGTNVPEKRSQITENSTP